MKPIEPQTPTRVGLISLGCAKNLVDAEIMLGSLLRSGVEIVNDPAQADAVIVNTCSFIDSAQEESVDTILESAQVREAANRGQGLIVSGCLTQRFRDELPKLFPEVDAFMGIDQVEKVGEIVRAAIVRRAERVGEGRTSKVRRRTSKEGLVARLNKGEKQQAHSGSEESLRDTERFGNTKTVLTTNPHPEDEGRRRAKPEAPVFEVAARPTYIPDYSTPRFRLTPRHFAYVKIAEGCNHPCSFCIIPRMRGSHRSRPQADVVAEAKALLAEGVKELNLISQDTTYYGLDLRPDPSRAIASPQRFSAATKSLMADATTLCTLLRELNALAGNFWIRLLYTHPAHWTDDLIRTIAECPKVARYVDMPLQHIHDNLLQRMRRETSGQYIRELIARIRSGIPGIALRTTFIVGFPGETESCFESLIEFIRDTKFERLGVFTYSREDGTVAGRMAGQLSAKARRARRDRAMAEQHKVARGVSASCVGREVTVLVEGKASERQLRQANVFSWEHGLLRESGIQNPKVGVRNLLVARGEADAPDIDGRVYVRGRLPTGEFARVRIVGHTDYDLLAEPV
jgi:ribosomal protein S12 methylthiotransferase